MANDEILQDEIDEELDFEDEEEEEMTEAEILADLIDYEPDGVFTDDSIYFVFYNGRIYEMPAGEEDIKIDMYPTIFTGASSEEVARVERFLAEFDLSRYDLSDIVDDDSVDLTCEEEVLEYLVDCGADDVAENLGRALEATRESSDCEVHNLFEIVDIIRRDDLFEGDLYYCYEGEVLDLYDNIISCNYGRGTYEEYTDAEWIEILENIEDYRVVAEEIDYSDFDC